MSETSVRPPFMAEYIEQLGTPATLEQAIRERDFWVEQAARFGRNEDYYRGLVVRCGNAIGEAAFVADDGSRSEDVLCAKVPELVEALAARSASYLADDQELMEELRTSRRKLPEAIKPTLTHRPLTFMEWPEVARAAYDRIISLKTEVSVLAERVKELSEVIAALADAANKCAEGPHYIVQPFLALYRKYGGTIAECRAAPSNTAAAVQS